MRFYNLTLILSSIFLFVFLFSSCNNSKPREMGSFDITFDILDKDVNNFNVSVRGRYTISANQIEKISEEYGIQYKETFIIPTVRTISREILQNFSAGDIYNYQRTMIEQKITDQIRTAFHSNDIELTDFNISSVELPDELMKRLKKNI